MTGHRRRRSRPRQLIAERQGRCFVHANPFGAASMIREAVTSPWPARSASPMKWCDSAACGASRPPQHRRRSASPVCKIALTGPTRTIKADRPAPSWKRADLTECRTSGGMGWSTPTRPSGPPCQRLGRASCDLSCFLAEAFHRWVAADQHCSSTADRKQAGRHHASKLLIRPLASATAWTRTDARPGQLAGTPDGQPVLEAGGERPVEPCVGRTVR